MAFVFVRNKVCETKDRAIRAEAAKRSEQAGDSPGEQGLSRRQTVQECSLMKLVTPAQKK